MPKNPLLRAITIAVLSVHCMFLLVLLLGPTTFLKKDKHKPLIVKTVTIQPTMKVSSPKTSAPRPIAQKSIAAKAASPQPKKAQPPTPVAAPKPAAQKKAPPIADKTLSTKKTPQTPTEKPRAKLSETKKERSPISADLVKELEKSISKIDEKKEKFSSKNKSALPRPQHSLHLQIDKHDLNTFDLNEIGETDYTDALVQCLHQSLHLPEFGEVKIQLTLRQDGTVAKLVVLNAESEKNKTYLENHLPRLKFPNLEGSFAQKKECTFSLTFCNEI